jgi:glycosyltransferase involved in cell wall biosynthesis
VRLEDPPVANKRCRVLVVAAAVHPLMGSEPGLGWNWIRGLSRYHDIWVITGERDGNREAINNHLMEHPELRDHLHISFIPRPDPPRTVRLWPPLYYHHYRLWHRKAFALATDLSKRVPFDLAHQLNITGYREPGYLWKLPLPFVWGPVAGHVQVPWRFLPTLGMKSACFYTCRNLINSCQMRTSIRVKHAMRRASEVIAATRVDLTAISRFHGRAAVLIGDTGMNLPSDSATGSPTRDGDRLRICWCGLFEGRKSLPLALRAIREASATVALTLHIVGDGPERRRWQRLASAMGVNNLCHWYGFVPRAEALRIIGKTDVMLISSLLDATSTVIFEALAYGKPVICHDACGFGDIVDDSCGIKIPMRSPRSSVKGFAEAIVRIARSPAVLAELSKGAAVRSERHTWDNKALQMSEVYRHVLAQNHTLQGG